MPVAQKFYAEWKIAALLPLWAAGLGVLQSWYASRRIPEKRPGLQMFLAAQTAFALALTVPLLLDGVWIYTAWSVLAFLLLAMGLRSRSRTLLAMSFLLYAVTQCLLLASGDFFRRELSYAASLLHHLLGAGVLTASWTAAAVLLFRTKDFSWVIPARRFDPAQLQKGFAALFAVIAGVCFLCCSSYEWHLCMREFHPGFADGILVLWWSLLILAALAAYRRYPHLTAFLAVLVILGALSLIWIVRMPGPPSPLPGLDGATPKGAYWQHLLNALLTRGIYVISLTAAGIELYRQNAPKKVTAGVLSLAGALFFLFSSQEIHTMLAFFLHGFRNGGVSVWWSLCAIALLFCGIKWRMKALRLAGVLLFAVCAAKVFFVDLAGLDQIWRIAAFAVIGVVILLGAVLYIRFRELFTENGKDDPA